MIAMTPIDASSLLESGMLVCFGVSWPVSIAKTLRVRQVSGKSLGFLLLVFVGYLMGIAGKLAFTASGGPPLPWVTWLYA